MMILQYFLLLISDEGGIEPGPGAEIIWQNNLGDQIHWQNNSLQPIEWTQN